MSVMLTAGLVLTALALVNLLDVVRRQGERFEYAGAMFLGELGLMFVAGQTIASDGLGLTVTIGFGVSILLTGLVWWKLFLAYKRRPSS